MMNASKICAGALAALTTLMGACSGPLVMVKTAKDPAKVLDCGSDSSKTCDLPGIPFYPVLLH